MLLEPSADGKFRMVGQPLYLIDGNPGVRVRQGGRDWFVWKEKRVEATATVLSELASFSADLTAALSPES